MSIPRYSSTISDTGATFYSALLAIIISPPPKSCRMCPFPSFFRLVRSFSHSLSPFPFFLFLRSALILALHGKKSVASCSRLRRSGRNYTEARIATDQHDRRPNYYYGKNRAGSCVLIFCKNLRAKREIARINVGFPAGLLSPRRWRERAKLSSMKIVRRRFARSKKKGRNIQYSNGRATFFRPAIFFCTGANESRRVIVLDTCFLIS